MLVACVAARLGVCDAVVANIQRLGSSQHSQDHSVRRVVAAHTKEIFGRTYSMVGGFGDGNVHVLPVDE